MAITPFFSLYTAIKLVYDIYEFYEADIKVYKLWNNQKIFDVKNVKYQEIQSLNFNIEEKYIHRRINGKNTKITF